MHTFAVYVEDQPGVLNRVSSLFRRRGFNINSLSVGTARAGISRMTVVVQTDDGGARGSARTCTSWCRSSASRTSRERPAVVRDLALIKVSADHEQPRRGHAARGRLRRAVVDVAPASLVVEIAGSEAKMDGLLEVLRPYGVLEMVRTGRVAMARGEGSRADRRAARRPRCPNTRPGCPIRCSQVRIAVR